MDANEISLIYVTTADKDEARRLAAALLNKQLIACANILPGMESVFVWEGAMQHEQEVSLLLKTATAKVAEVKQAIVEAHSYDCPCIVVWPLSDGHAGFLQWIATETQ